MSAYILTLTSLTFITNLVQAQSYTLQTTPTEDTWQASSITPTQSTDYGTIRIGQQMSMEFDFIFHGRSNTPRPDFKENFFRIGHSAALVKGCDGEDSRYPSMWLTYTGDGDILDISTSSGTSCTPIYKLTNYNEINPESTHHMEITINNSFVSIDIRGGGKPNYNQYFSRNPTQEKYLNDSVPVWFMSNKFDGADYNIGSATFSNIIIRSSVFTTTPVLIPTGPPTVKPTTPTGPPTVKPTTPTGPPTVKPTTPTGPPTVKPTTPTGPPTVKPTTPTGPPTVKPTTPTGPPTIPYILPTGPTTTIPTKYPTISPTKYPTKYPTVSPTKYPTKYPTRYPSKSPTKYPTRYPSKYPTKYPSKYPTKYPTYQPSTLPTVSPITKMPTASPVTKMPTVTRGPTTEKPTGAPTMQATLSTLSTMSSRPTIGNPTTSEIVTNSPTKTPVKEGVVGVDTTVVVMDYDLEDDDNIVMDDTKGILIGVSIGTTLFISGCFIWGICILCKKERKSIRKLKKVGSDTNNLKISTDSAQVIMDFNGFRSNNRMTADFDVTNINIANSYNKQFSPEDAEQYLSDAQKEDLCKTAGGSSNRNSNVELQGDDSQTDASIIFDEYLSDAQKEEMRENQGITPHSEGGPLPINEPHLRREPTTEDVDDLMKMKDESDNDFVQQHVDIPIDRDLSPIVLGNTPVGDTADGPENGDFVEIVYDEGDNNQYME